MDTPETPRPTIDFFADSTRAQDCFAGAGLICGVREATEDEAATQPGVRLKSGHVLFEGMTIERVIGLGVAFQLASISALENLCAAAVGNENLPARRALMAEMLQRTQQAVQSTQAGAKPRIVLPGEAPAAQINGIAGRLERLNGHR